uniref:Uncharacterized protein n=1 Tax=Romanomermis culicivorax TaxID=13658 RepID=A0A915KTA8_ROMCU
MIKTASQKYLRYFLTSNSTGSGTSMMESAVARIAIKFLPTKSSMELKSSVFTLASYFIEKSFDFVLFGVEFASEAAFKSCMACAACNSSTVMMGTLKLS